eukprot:TRINITY_DN5040_c0_g1_i1.p1 TRINITY_DN5040_c0_g1~~TRINITY_DN5040_c0_g1_i1.p1  ORF type:complete len:239 (-),score=23.78 TRINITY_DN5040_c0_g1_i1:159-875(-)
MENGSETSSSSFFSLILGALKSEPKVSSKEEKKEQPQEPPKAPEPTPDVSKPKEHHERSKLSSAHTPTRSSHNATKLLRTAFTRIHKSGTSDVDGYSVELVEDNLYKWHVKFYGFDTSTQIAEDLFMYESARPGRQHVLVEVLFPNNYPSAPPFMRVVYPQFHQFTGHITNGGAICVQELTMSGWKPEFELAAFFVMIRNLLLEGSALINMDKAFLDYTEAEAREAFVRTCQTHGWSY